ncbi:uncharacterized protein LOC134767287 [Penaeus indicus]|uniref:uncharacterized protein LOC134767287 n=1 Tax=Penaeus indicus TaxID=29960 RepID=UPI00300DA71C
MGDISRTLGRSCRRTPSKGQDSLTTLICRKLRESGQDDEFLQSVMDALFDLRDELSRCPSRKESIKLVRRTLSRAIAEGKRGQDMAEDSQDDLGARPIVQLLEEELKGEKEEEAQKETLAEGELECGEDVPDHRGTTGTRPQKDDHKTSEGEQLTKDSNDAPPSILTKENKISDEKGGNTQETAILNGVQIERIFPRKRCSFSHFYGEEDRETMSVKLVVKNNKCTLYKLEDDAPIELGVFHADNLTKLENGFKVSLETETPCDDVDGGKRVKETRTKKKEASLVILTIPQEQQEECMNVISKMRRSLFGILFGKSTLSSSV